MKSVFPVAVRAPYAQEPLQTVTTAARQMAIQEPVDQRFIDLRGGDSMLSTPMNKMDDASEVTFYRPDVIASFSQVLNIRFALRRESCRGEPPFDAPDGR
jgi:hypothetical protein